ncbi:MAG: RNHCP domain-containing protein [Chloroflexi bacterium]|nr:RNHCP domain-containing protein [Chloroflexota bacterium]
MSRTTENTAFACLHCGLEVLPLSNGSYRNHCPRCLYSKHLDVAPGDRASSCKGPMKPVGMRYKSGKEFQIVHRCTACGVMRPNKIAADTVQPDELEALLRLPTT